MPNTYTTDDMSLAAFLRLSHDIVKRDWRGRTCSWTFATREETGGLIIAFKAGNALVDPLEYNKSFRELKEESFSEDEWGTGTIVFFDEARGYGFIKRANAGDDVPDVFFHVTAIDEDHRANSRLRAGSVVDFTIKTGPRGESCKALRFADTDGCASQTA